MMPTKVNSSGSAIVLTARDRRVVGDVAEFGILSRQQLQRLGHFGSKTRANATLLRLVRHEYLSRRTLPSVAGSHRALYLIGRRAPALLEGPRPQTQRERQQWKGLSDLFVEHQLLVNEVRFQFHCPTEHVRCERWLSDTTLRTLGLGVVPDGYIEYRHGSQVFAAFLELDRGTETLSRWDAKVRSYLALASSGRFTTALGRRFFRVWVVTTSAERLNHIRVVVARQTNRIFWFVTMDALQEFGPFAEIWLRVVDSGRHALTEP